jgi:hypothetical protein
METLEARGIRKKKSVTQKRNGTWLEPGKINHRQIGLNHKGELTKVFERAAWDIPFYADFVKNGVEALKEYGLIDAEKRALLLNDVNWIKKHHGPLTAAQNYWFEHRLSVEVW